MENELRRHLRACAEAYASSRGIKVSTVGRAAARDWRFFDRILLGKSFTVRTYDEVMRWFALSWPEALAWPEGVPRPQLIGTSPQLIEGSVEGGRGEGGAAGHETSVTAAASIVTTKAVGDFA